MIQIGFWQSSKKDIEGRPLLGRVIDRTKLIRGINKIILATSNRKIDNGISDFAESEGLEIFREVVMMSMEEP